MLKIGLTGGAGAGKSRVLSWLETERGAVVIRTDEVAKQIMEPGEEGYVRVVETFGKTVLDKEGRIDRPALAAIIFKDEGARDKINSITHPLVWERVRREIAGRDAAEFVVVESALFDKQSAAFFDEVWYVYAPEEVRIQRLMETRGYTRERCVSMLSSQPSEQAFREISSRVIINNGDWDKTAEALSALRQ